MKGGGRRIGRNGYVQVWRPSHPLAMKDGYVYEHRMVAWDAGLITNRRQVVHHHNGDKTDNRLENLVSHPTHDSHMTTEHYAPGMMASNQFGRFPVRDAPQRGDGKGRKFW